MSQYVIRYQLNEQDIKRLVLVEAKSLEQAVDKTFKYIDKMHNLTTDAERESVIIDDSNPYRLC